MQSKIKIISLLIVCFLISSCATTVKVINYDDTEYFEMDKEDEHYHCMSSYYLEKILNVKIKKVNPK
jgi:starvation-inducible outer membrane lipoprotein